MAHGPSFPKALTNATRKILTMNELKKISVRKKNRHCSQYANVATRRNEMQNFFSEIPREECGCYSFFIVKFYEFLLAFIEIGRSDMSI